MSRLNRAVPRRLTQPLLAALTALAAALLTAALEWRAFDLDLTQEHAYQVREVEEGLAGLHRDLMAVAHLSSAAPDHHENEVGEYVAARRDAFAAVRWLGYLDAPGRRPRVLLTSPEARAYDPRRDTAVSTALKTVEVGGMAATLPSAPRQVASLALVLGPLEHDGGHVVALVNGDELLDDSLRAIGRGTPSFTLAWQSNSIGHWPRSEPESGGIAASYPVAMADKEFTVLFSPPDAAMALRHVTPMPLMVLLTGLAVTALLARGGGTAPAAPRLPAPPGAGQAHRTRLWQLGELAASLSHDLGQPLNVIRLSAEAALDAAEGGRLDGERLRRTLTNTVEQTLRAQDMLDQLIAVTRRPSTTPVPLAPVRVARQVLADTLPLLRSHGIRLLWHADLSAPTVGGHPQRLAAALRHLLLNACEALSANRLETGRAGTVHVRCRRHGDGVAIEVMDDGPGFPAALRAALADPTAAPAGIGKGCGLGLAVAQGVAAEMGGSLTIADGQPGTRVVLTLPPLRRSLLLAEDDAAAAAQLAEALSARGWQVRVAGGGNPALALFLQHGADALVTDLHMADGDGWHLIEQVRARAPDLPVIAMSTADGPDAQRAVAAGAALVMRKPLSARELREGLEELTGEHW